jgi:hypothetical protein
VRNLSGWLTTIVARVSLTMLQSRRSRREEALYDDATCSPSSTPTWYSGPTRPRSSWAPRARCSAGGRWPRCFSGRARAARLALVDGVPGLVWAAGGAPRVVFTFTVVAGRVAAIQMTADPDRLAELDLAVLD